MSKPKPAVRRSTDWCHTQAPQEITRYLLKCGYEGYDYGQIFDDYLEACEIWLDRLPSMFNQIVHGERLEDPPDIADRFARLERKYKRQTLEQFASAFGVMLDASMDEDGKHTYADLFGGTFMEFVWKSDAKYRGQFFTPWNVARMMAQMMFPGLDDELNRRMEAALEHNSSYQLGKLLDVNISLETKLLLMPDVREHFQPITICDPACGSGIMLLASASLLPRWAIEHRLVEFYGVDIDATCTKMAMLNCRLYGVNGCGYQLHGFDEAISMKATPAGESPESIPVTLPVPAPANLERPLTQMPLLIF